MKGKVIQCKISISQWDLTWEAENIKLLVWILKIDFKSYRLTCSLHFITWFEINWSLLITNWTIRTAFFILPACAQESNRKLHIHQGECWTLPCHRSKVNDSRGHRHPRERETEATFLGSVQESSKVNAWMFLFLILIPE